MAKLMRLHVALDGRILEGMDSPLMYVPDADDSEFNQYFQGMLHMWGRTPDASILTSEWKEEGERLIIVGPPSAQYHVLWEGHKSPMGKNKYLD